MLSYHMKKNALIISGNGGIGLALVKKLLQENFSVVATYRSEKKSKDLISLKNENLKLKECDPLKEDDLIKLKKQCPKLDLLINCVGTLEFDGYTPEKSLRDIDLKQLEKYFLINNFLTPLIGKVFREHFNKNSKFVVLSAKVGSIEDNRLGGWYGYRASKAALNMFLKNIHIEFKRSRKDICVLSIHPGTTETNLSQNFLENFNLKVHKPHESANNIYNVIYSKGLSESGKFFSWDGEELPW